MKLSSVEKSVYELVQKEYSFYEIAQGLGKSIEYAKSIYKRAKFAKDAEKVDEIATLYIPIATYRRYIRLIHMYDTELYLDKMDLHTLDGLAKAINENKFKAFNRKVSRSKFTDKMIDQLIFALEQKGYKINTNYSRTSDNEDLAISLTSDVICNHSERMIKFDILEFSGILTCQHDGTDPHVYLSKSTKYNRDKIADKVIELMKEEGYII